MPNKPTIVKGESFIVSNNPISSDFSEWGFDDDDIKAIFDVAHEALEDVLRAAPADFVARLPSEIQMYCGSRPFACASAEFGNIQYHPIPDTYLEYDMTIPDVVGIALHDLKHEQLREPFSETVRSYIRHELFHIITHRATNVNLHSISESVVARLEQAYFGGRVLYSEDMKKVKDFGHRVRCTTGFRSPDGLLTRFDDEAEILIYDAGKHALDGVEADELWEILRKLTAVADIRGLYPRYLDIRTAMQQVLGDDRALDIERTPTFAEMHPGIHGMVSENNVGLLHITPFRSEVLNASYLLPPFSPLPCRYAVSTLPIVQLAWQIFECGERFALDGDWIKDTHAPLKIEPEEFTQQALGRFVQDKHIAVDRLELSLYEKTTCKDPYFVHIVDDPLGDKLSVTL